MNVLSTFDGISCGQIALLRAGIKPKRYYASEVDAHVIGITQKHYPKTVQLGSVTRVTRHCFNRGGVLICLLADRPARVLAARAKGLTLVIRVARYSFNTFAYLTNCVAKIKICCFFWKMS